MISGKVGRKEVREKAGKNVEVLINTIDASRLQFIKEVTFLKGGSGNDLSDFKGNDVNLYIGHKGQYQEPLLSEKQVHLLADAVLTGIGGTSSGEKASHAKVKGSLPAPSFFGTPNGEAVLFKTGFGIEESVEKIANMTTTDMFKAKEFIKSSLDKGLQP